MTDDREVDRLLELALRGDRANLRVFLDEAIDHSADHPRHVLSDVIAPALGSLEAVSREDRATAAAIASEAAAARRSLSAPTLRDAWGRASCIHLHW